MPQPFSFDFGDRFLEVNDWRLAFRVYTEVNVYTPHPDAIRIRKRDDGMVVEADRFAWAGLQQSREGRFVARIRSTENGLAWSITARLSERIKGTATFIRGVGSGEVAMSDFSFAPLQQGRNDLLMYPTELKLPVYMLRHGKADYTVVTSEDAEVRSKAFAIVPEKGGGLLELQHHEDARKWSVQQQTPVWRIERARNPEPLLWQRMRIAEEAWGLRPWDERSDVPDWARRIGLVLNLHGTHWTGFIFNDYARQLEILRHVCRRIEGRHVLAYLPAWDGRYNFNWPKYEADTRMGGRQGLRRLVRCAHALGVRVIPQIGAVSANKAFLPPALHAAAIQDAYGNTFVKGNEWDNDRASDTYRINASVGHPGFRQFLFDKICGLKDEFDFDGIFLDINHDFHNDPRFHITEGHLALARMLHERYEDFLMFGEHWYDGLLPAYPLVHSVVTDGHLKNWPQIFEKYARTTYHLIHPAPGRGSTGVYEAGFMPPLAPDPKHDVIPAISFVEDTLKRHRREIELRIHAARRYLTRKRL
ncbi:MAG: hypothetical protein HY360_02740 [Verrucomicrobia bacterium]|nr:hypothetical protein [Verrucomicrobiota bacterium]